MEVAVTGSKTGPQAPRHGTRASQGSRRERTLLIGMRKKQSTGAMDNPLFGRHIGNILEYPNGYVVCLDTNLHQISELTGAREEILPLLRKMDLSQARIQRKVPKGTGFAWEPLNRRRFLGLFI